MKTRVRRLKCASSVVQEVSEDSCADVAKRVGANVSRTDSKMWTFQSADVLNASVAILHNSVLICSLQETSVQIYRTKQSLANNPENKACQHDTRWKTGCGTNSPNFPSHDSERYGMREL